MLIFHIFVIEFKLYELLVKEKCFVTIQTIVSDIHTKSPIDESIVTIT